MLSVIRGDKGVHRACIVQLLSRDLQLAGVEDYTLLMRANKLETALSRDHLYSLSGPPDTGFFMFLTPWRNRW